MITQYEYKTRQINGAVRCCHLVLIHGRHLAGELGTSFVVSNHHGKDTQAKE